MPPTACGLQATSNLDGGSDEAIQLLLRSEFGSLTVLTIAHRLHTVIDYDALLVMGAGRLLESGAPHELLAAENGVLASMARALGEAGEAALLERWEPSPSSLPCKPLQLPFVALDDPLTPLDSPSQIDGVEDDGPRRRTRAGGECECAGPRARRCARLGSQAARLGDGLGEESLREHAAAGRDGWRG